MIFLVRAAFSDDRTVELGLPPCVTEKLAPLAVGPGGCIYVILCSGLNHQPAPEIVLLGAMDLGLRRACSALKDLHCLYSVGLRSGQWYSSERLEGKMGLNTQGQYGREVNPRPYRRTPTARACGG